MSSRVVATYPECNTTLELLSEETGLSKETLLGFANGTVPLSAADRLRILAALNAHTPPPLRLREAPSVGSVARVEIAWHLLRTELSVEATELRDILVDGLKQLLQREQES